MKPTTPHTNPNSGGYGRNLPPWRSSADYTDAAFGPQRRVKPRAVAVKRATRSGRKVSRRLP